MPEASPPPRPTCTPPHTSYRGQNDVSLTGIPASAPHNPFPPYAVQGPPMEFLRQHPSSLWYSSHARHNRAFSSSAAGCARGYRDIHAPSLHRAEELSSNPLDAGNSRVRKPVRLPGGHGSRGRHTSLPDAAAQRRNGGRQGKPPRHDRLTVQRKRGRSRSADGICRQHLHRGASARLRES